MSYKLLYTPIALIDYKTSTSWYAVRSSKAAENFVVEVKNCTTAICNNPLQFKNRYKNFRETSLKKYPFYIIYFVDDVNNVVIVTAIYHHKRSPRHKYKK
jgi:plasmid stabilization system protein ParE